MRKTIYVAVNEELNMSSRKVAAQVSHAIIDYILSNKDNNILLTLSDYKCNGDTVVTLRVKQKEIEKLKENGFVVVVDSGRTEISPNSLTVAFLGIYDKDNPYEIPKSIRRMQLYK